MVTAFAILAMFDIINAPQETRIMPDFNNLTLLRATPSAVSKVWGGRSAPPPQTPPRFLRVLGGYQLEPQLLPRMTPDKRIYYFAIPRTTPVGQLMV